MKPRPVPSWPYREYVWGCLTDQRSAVTRGAGGGRATGRPECVALQAKAEELEGASKSKVEEDEERPGHGSLLRGCRGGGAQC